MIVKLLGILDIFSALVLLSTYFFTPTILIWIAGAYLIIKGAIFLVSWTIVSILDVIAGIILLSTLTFQIPTVLLILTSFFLLQKGVISLL